MLITRSQLRYVFALLAFNLRPLSVRVCAKCDFSAHILRIFCRLYCILVRVFPAAPPQKCNISYCATRPQVMYISGRGRCALLFTDSLNAYKNICGSLQKTRTKRHQTMSSLVYPSFLPDRRCCLTCHSSLFSLLFTYLHFVRLHDISSRQIKKRRSPRFGRNTFICARYRCFAIRARIKKIRLRQDAEMLAVKL